MSEIPYQKFHIAYEKEYRLVEALALWLTFLVWVFCVQSLIIHEQHESFSPLLFYRIRDWCSSNERVPTIPFRTRKNPIYFCRWRKKWRLLQILSGDVSLTWNGFLQRHKRRHILTSKRDKCHAFWRSRY